MTAAVIGPFIAARHRRILLSVAFGLVVVLALGIGAGGVWESAWANNNPGCAPMSNCRTQG
jgi:hypothetical protein